MSFEVRRSPRSKRLQFRTQAEPYTIGAWKSSLEGWADDWQYLYGRKITDDELSVRRNARHVDTGSSLADRALAELARRARIVTKKGKGPLLNDLKPEFKAFDLKIDSLPDEDGRFSGLAAVFENIDLGNDVIERGAFTKTLQENPEVPILWQHNPDEPIGISVSMKEDERGLRVEGQLALDVERGRDARSLMKLGALKGLSIGYRAIKPSFERGVRHLKEIQLLEFSPVVFPMNPEAGVDTVKSHKWLGQYGATESVDCILSMIGAGTDFLAYEVGEGDTEDVERMQTVLSTLADILASEIEDVVSGESNGDADSVTVWVEAMREPLDAAIKKLESLRDAGPAVGAVSKAEPESDGVISTLRDLKAVMTRPNPNI